MNRSTHVFDLPGVPIRHALRDCHKRLNSLLQDSQTPLENRLARLAQAARDTDACQDWARWLSEGKNACDDFGMVMARCRAAVNILHDDEHMPTDPAQRARLESLMVTALLLDGLMNARRDSQAGLAPLLPINDLRKYMVTEEQILNAEVDFAWRRFVEAYAQRLFALLQAVTPLGRGWLAGMKYRLAIVLLERHVNILKQNPEAAFDDTPPRLKPADWPPLFWRVIKTR